MKFLSLLALAASLVAGMEFTDPAANSTLTTGSYYDLTWDSVDTDPSTFSIYLVNFVNWPPYYAPLALDIETALGAYQVYVPCNVDNSYGYQFNAINGTNVYVIYAQTPKFTIGGTSCTDPTTTSVASTCALASAATVTVTVSTTLSSGWAGNATTATVTGAAGPTTTTTVTTRVTVGAKCPDTIGWGASGYSYPVTLTSVPHEPAATAAATTKAAVLAAGSQNPNYGFTSTVYNTVYMDLAEFQAAGGCQC